MATGVGVILFWPTLLMIKGDAETDAQLAQLKGEMEAVEQTSIKKKCGIEFQKPAPKACSAIKIVRSLGQISLTMPSACQWAPATSERKNSLSLGQFFAAIVLVDWVQGADGVAGAKSNS